MAWARSLEDDRALWAETGPAHRLAGTGHRLGAGRSVINQTHPRVGTQTERNDGGAGLMEQEDLKRGERGELREPWRWLAGAVTVLLIMGIVGGLVFYRLGLRSPSNQTVGSTTVSGVDLTCRLPVLAGAAGGFITFPSGAVTIDRSVSLDPYKGGYGYTYDAHVGRWVSVPASALSPDGRSYAYLAQTSGVPGNTTVMSLHTHEIASGKDRVLWAAAGSPTGPNVLTWLTGGIYFSAILVP